MDEDFIVKGDFIEYCVGVYTAECLYNYQDKQDTTLM